MFKALPDRYAPPQYPGFWAMSLANGAKAEPDPANGSSATARLYLFGNPSGGI